MMDPSAGALAGDMGLSTVLHPAPWGDCTAAQCDCRTVPDGQEGGLRDGLEVDRASLDLVIFPARNLAVPERRSVDDPAVLRGKKTCGPRSMRHLKRGSACSICNLVRLKTAASALPLPVGPTPKARALRRSAGF